jgi:hypothetical protein
MWNCGGVVPTGTLPTPLVVVGKYVRVLELLHIGSLQIPAYGGHLAIPFKSGGAFSVALRVAANCGKISFAMLACAVYVRSPDHCEALEIPLTISRSQLPLVNN